MIPRDPLTVSFSLRLYMCLISGIGLSTQLAITSKCLIVVNVLFGTLPTITIALWLLGISVKFSPVLNDL